MKKNYYLFTLCAILFGFTINAQTNRNIGISETTTGLAITANTQLVKSLIIGANTVNAAGATDAIQNTGFGVQALDNLKQGDNNTAFGYNAGTAIGGAAGSGSGNTLIGRASGYQIGAGEYNTAVGNQSATEVIGGDYNTFIGSGAKGDLGNAQGRIGIGQGVVVSSDLTAVIGKNTVTNVYFGGMAAGEWNATLHATGITLENSETITNASDGTVVVSGNLTVSSDMRLKDNIKSLGNTISEILKLDGKSYTRDGRNEIGLLAQDLELVYPELVSVDGNGMLAVNYQALAPVLINGVKDQEARIAKQEERIAKLEILVNLLLNGK
ncbi:MAG: hypothetical protein CMC38_07850 [Flavobacteriaceae bacterium]|nr:hypothetical protein [Flavobacteriaceae bacterium]|tara:strand:- start:8704 stop:9681 length:978 start_codon:yes stop_codon:yes gene_type:complete